MSVVLGNSDGEGKSPAPQPWLFPTQAILSAMCEQFECRSRKFELRGVFVDLGTFTWVGGWPVTFTYRMTRVFPFVGALPCDQNARRNTSSLSGIDQLLRTKNQDDK